MTAKVTQATASALRSPRDADLPPVLDKPVTEIAAFLRRHDLPERPFHLRRFLHMINQPQQIADPDAVCIGDNRRLSEHIAHDQVGALSPNTGKRQKLVKIRRNLIMIGFVQNTHAFRNIPRLAVSEPAGPDDFLYLGGIGDGQISHRRKPPVKERRDLIHPFVPALRGKTDADQQLPRVLIGQGTVRVGISFLRPVDDGQRQFFFRHSLTRIPGAFHRVPSERSAS